VNRLGWITFLLGLGLISTQAQESYREPDFKMVLFDPSQLGLDEAAMQRLACALTALARNFPHDAEVSPRAKAMGLVLSLHLCPQDRDAVVANYFLRRGVPPTPTAYFREKADVLVLLENLFVGEERSEADDHLVLLLTDVLDELLGRERSNGRAWLGTVEAAPRPLARKTAEVFYIGMDGDRRSWRVDGELADDRQEQLVIQGPEGSVQLSQVVRERLEQRYPYAVCRLRLGLEGKGFDSMDMGERDTLLELLIMQLVDGWEWDSRLVVCGVGSRARHPPELLKRLSSQLRRETRDFRFVMISPVKPNFFHDWMALDHMHRLVATEIMAAKSADDVARWHVDRREWRAVHALFGECRTFLGNRPLNRHRLFDDHRVFLRLRQISTLTRSHVSAAALWSYGHLPGEMRASSDASREWLDIIADKVMLLKAKAYTPNFKERLCDKAVERIRAMRSRLHPQVKPLAAALEQFIEKHAIPFCSVQNKGTSTGKRQFKKLVRAISEWKVLYEENVKTDS